MMRLVSAVSLLGLSLLVLAPTVAAQDADTTQAEPPPPNTTPGTVDADTTGADSLATADSTTADTLSAAARRSRAEKRARAAASSWLSLTDAGQFGDSWDAAAPYFRDRISRDDWIDQGTAAQSTLDSLTTRTLRRARYRDSTAQIPTGNPVVTLEYLSEFAEQSVLEAVVATRPDTTWKVAGYRIIPAPNTTLLPDSTRAPDRTQAPAAPAADSTGGR